MQMPVVVCGAAGYRAGRSELVRLADGTTVLHDVLDHELDVVFVGFNPGRFSAAAGHHFAGPANHFWRLLYESDMTPRRLSPVEDMLLLEYGLGVTNIVARMTPGSADLSWDELIQGGLALQEKMKIYRPRFVCLLGKDVYRGYAGLRRSTPVAYGLQTVETVSGVREFVVPNPSPRSTLPYKQRLNLMRQLTDVAGKRE